MTRPEEKYRARLLILKAVGEIKDFIYQPPAITLDAETHYTPDFRVELPSGNVRIVEVKGSRKTPKMGKWRPYFKSRDSILRLRWSAQLHPAWEHVLTWWNLDKGKWDEKIV